MSVLALLSLLLAGESTSRVREIAYARVPLAERIARDNTILSSLERKNAGEESLKDITKKDAEWVANPRYGLRHEMTTGPCSDALRGLVTDDTFVVEALVMDSRGALVCASREPSDYWQGDEAKWQRTYGDGKQVFVDEPALDANTGIYAIQLSVLISTRGQKAGALTLTLKVPAAAVPAGR